ncbi:MAG: family 78 glycoside hydrolase catalytic domain [Candidatus Cryptobacteroides sp.]
MKKILASLAFILASIAANAAVAVNLRCEYLTSPLSIDNPHPMLSWMMESKTPDAYQTAWQVMVASSPELLKADKADLWDSGRREGSGIAVEYAGKGLEPFSRCYWKVRIWDEKGKASAWSRTAEWAMGAISAEDWTPARWISAKPDDLWREEWQQRKAAEKAVEKLDWPMYNGMGLDIWDVAAMTEPAYDPSPLMRRTFEVKAKPVRAMLYVTGLGYYEAFINGKRVGDQVLDPGWTYYNKHTAYNAFDVLPMLRSGDNAIGIMLGRGQYNPLCNDIWRLCTSEWVGQPKAKALLRIEYPDGSVSVVGTDGNWCTTGGPIVYDDTRLGEIYDARLEREGWSTAAYDDSAWGQAVEVDWDTDLKFQCQPPVRTFEGIRPVRTIARSDTETVFDMGRNLAGWARVKVNGKAGQKVLVEYCEIVSDSLLAPWLPEYRRNYPEPDGDYASFYDSEIRVRQQNGYILKGDPKGETFECHFSYKGFQWVRITTDEGVRLLEVESIPVHTDLKSAGSFQCSDPSINLLQRNSINSMMSNYISIPTDCPHREKQGWTADAFIAAEAAMYNFDMANFYSNWLRALADSESPDGSLPTVAPSTNYDINSSTTWPSAIVRVATDLYRHYGEARPAKDYLGCMKRFIFNSSQRTLNGNPYIINDVLGDWVSPTYDKPGFTMAPPEGTPYYGTATHAYCLSAIADLALLAGDKATADSLERCAAVFRKGFNREFFDKESASYHGTIPTPEYRQATNAVALEYGLVPPEMEEKVREGLIADLKAHDYRIGTGFLGTPALMNYLPLHDPNTAFKVATQPEYPGFTHMLSDNSTTLWENWSGEASRNHLPFALISAYYYKFLAGIRADGPGFATFTVAPTAVENLSWVKAHHDTMYGRISSEWRREGNRFTLTVSVPANTVCTVVLPSREGDIVHRVGSGRHTFRSDL